jgi:hypothetical protein
VVGDVELFDQPFEPLGPLAQAVGARTGLGDGRG